MEVTDSYLYGGSKECLHPWKLVNPKVGKNDFRNSKDQNGLLNNISFQVLAEPYSHFGNREKSYVFGLNRFHKSGKCCSLGQSCTSCTTISSCKNELWHHDTTTAVSIKYSGGRYFTVYHSPVGRWFPRRNWCVPVGTVVIRFWTDLSISKRAS